MPLVDNRQFIEALEKTGDMEKIAGYPGHRILGAPLATYRRLAIALGLAPDAPSKAIQAESEHRLEHPVKPKVVKDGPCCKENVVLGEDVDLYRFPVPMIHDGDGGRYIGTWHLVVTQDPDSPWTNWGMYRTMVYNKRLMGMQFAPVRHAGEVFYQKYLPRKLPMPFAIAIGADPLCSLAAATPFRKGESEVDYAGGLLQEAVELVKCETSGLLVPAHAEIILEGEILPDSLLLEGPFGEYTGYRTPERREVPTCRVKAITHRNNPIFTMTNMGIPQQDQDISALVGAPWIIKGFLRKYGIPVTEVHYPPEMSIHVVVIGVKTTEGDPAGEIRNVLLPRIDMPVVIVVVEEVDVFNMDEVFYALATKCHPLRGITIEEHQLKNSLMSYYSSPEEKESRRGGFVLFDCTWPPDWPKDSYVPQRMSFKEAYPQGIREKVIKEWKNYGFE
jgi:4-hydroxy-3-polyprenylbenzoate decarboxylase